MKSKSILLFTFIMSLAVTANAEHFPLCDPGNEGGWSLNESVSDEFSGDSLDSNKWTLLGLNGDYKGRWKGRAPSQYASDNVSVEGGHFTITTKWDPDFEYSSEPLKGVPYGKPIPITTGCIISKAKFKYGYMEMRCKAADGPVSSAFWTTGLDGELDVFEHFGQKPNDVYSARRFHTSFHDWRKGSPTMGKRIWTNDHQLDFRVADDFHVYGMEWNPQYIKIHVDGKLVNCISKEEIGDAWVATNEQMVWIDSELFPWEIKSENLKAPDFADGRNFVVDYCRIWQRSQTGSCESRKNLISNPGFENGLDSWSGKGVESNESQKGQSAAMLNTGGQIYQSVTVKPNTTYVLAGWAKSPETNEKNLWFNCYLGVREHGGPEMNTRYFFPDYHEKSLQFKTGSSTTKVVVFFSNQSQGKKALIDEVELVESIARSDQTN